MPSRIRNALSGSMSCTVPRNWAMSAPHAVKSGSRHHRTVDGGNDSRNGGSTDSISEEP